MNDPVMAWNLFSTPVLITALGYFIKKLIDDTQKNAEKRSEVTSAELAAIRACLTAIKIDLESRIERKECETKSAQKWEVIYHHKHTQDGEVVVPQ